MDLKKKLSEWVIAQITKQNPDISATKVAELEYGFLSLYATVTKFIVIIALAIVFKVLPVVLVVTATFMAVRTWAGGIHTDSSLSCLVYTLIIYFGVAFCAINITLPLPVLYCLAALATMLIYKYAPADIANKPIRGPKHQRRLKLFAIGFALLFTAISVVVSAVLRNAIIYSIIVESLMITPLAYAITKTKGGEFYEENSR